MSFAETCKLKATNHEEYINFKIFLNKPVIFCYIKKDIEIG